jgi:release factor glutamine methyltransferase
VSDTSPEDNTVSDTSPEDNTVSDTPPENTVSDAPPEDNSVSDTPPEDNTVSDTPPEDNMVSDTSPEDNSVSDTSPEDNTVSDTFSVLDLCTGSGAVAIALKHERPGLAVYASDISPAALAIARGNAARLLGDNAVTFIQSDLFAAFRDPPENAKTGPDTLPRRFNLIVSNPPYVPSAVIPTLSSEVQREPHLALDGGNDGLTFIRKIITESRDYLAPGGALLLEADPQQMETIAGILAVQGYIGVKKYKDLSSRPRVIFGKTPNGETRNVSQG